MPPCLSRKPKRAESEIPSLPEAGPAVLSFERQHGKINGHLLRELLGHSELLPHGQTASGPVVCCCCCRVSLHCLLWEDFQPCTAIKISVFSLFVYICPRHTLSFSLFPAFDHSFGQHSHRSRNAVTNTIHDHFPSLYR